MKPLKNNIFTRLLTIIFRFIIFARNLWYDTIPATTKKTPFKVISIGSPKAGGTGKTPLSLLVGELLIQNNHTIGFLSRGYGRQSKKNIIVSPNEETTWEKVGDEPMLLKNNLPKSWLAIGANRIVSVKKIIDRVPHDTILIMDDGFQHRKVARDINIITLPPNPFSDKLIPVGYLREPLSSIKRASCICIIGNKNEHEIMKNTRKKLNDLFTDTPVFTLFQDIDTWVNATKNEKFKKIPFKKVGVICGIAKPERFLKDIDNMGIIPSKTLICNDHHVFTEDEISTFLDSDIDGIVTTEKDFVRLNTNTLVKSLNICYLKIRLAFEYDYEKAAFEKLLGITS